MQLSHQTNPDIARLAQELERDDVIKRKRLTDLEAMATYVRAQLVPYLRGLAASVAFPAPPEPPR